MLENVIIRPLELVLEIFFCVINKLLHDPGLSLVIVSIIINLILLPLYISADALSDRNQRDQERFEHYRKMISGTFKGDERMFILNYYYKISGYSPLSALSSVVPLLLQVPFFIAAYSFFSGLEILEKASLFGIHDLTQPDGLINAGNGIVINVLPVMMTLINIVSGIIYTRGKSTGQKVQVWILAALFFFLLYGSPSGLVIYWTINNLFSLGRSIVSLAVKKDERKPVIERPDKEQFLGTVAAGSFITVLLGVYVPADVISLGPSEFAFALGDTSPFAVILSVFCIFLGIQLWGLAVSYIGGRIKRAVYEYILLALAGMMTADIFISGYTGGKLTTVLSFITAPAELAVKDLIYNLFVVFTVAALLIALSIRFRKSLRSIMVAATLALAVISFYRMSTIRSELQKGDEYSVKVEAQERVIPLSTKGKNVMVIMLDRAMSRYVPFMFNEDPELIRQFSGFTWYPNTASFGRTTNYGAPALFGGYDYAPARINERKEERLVDKHNESLRVMPAVFAGAGFRVTAADMPLVNYQAISDMSIYDDIEGVNGINLSRYVKSDEYAGYAYECMKRNFVFFSLYRGAPKILADLIYDEGSYLNPEGQVKYIDPGMAHEYNALKSLEKITEIEESEEDTFFVMSSSVTHQPMVLKLPEYEIAVSGSPLEELPDRMEFNGLTCDFTGSFSKIYSIGHYHVNMLAFRTLGAWFDRMREAGVYDNTRIILVADHGWDLYQFEDMILEFGENRFDIEAINPLPMVKDFDSTEIVTDYSFMTNADTPALAMEGLIDHPVNPYTGKSIDQSPKSEGIEVHLGTITDTRINNGTTFLPEESPWFGLHDSIFDAENYSYYWR